jgi:TolB-like protein/Tfp pilus assembly protein PilF
MGTGQISFGPFILDRSAQTLLSGGKPIALGQRGYALLEALASADGNVSKAELIEAAWPGTTVEEGNLTVQIAALRKALGERPDGQEWIVTVPRVGYRLLREPHSAVVEPRTIPALAVLPFHNLGGDPEQDYFADGMVEGLITALSRFRSFAVIARSSSFAYKGRSVDVRLVASELGVRYVLEGSVRRAGERLRATAQLVDAQSGRHLWAHNFDGRLDDIFDVQDSITASVAAVVEPTVRQAEIERSRIERPGSIAAHDLLLRAWQKLNSYGEADNRDAIRLLEQTLELDPDYAQALGAAVYAYEHRMNMSWPAFGESDRGRCLELVRAALVAGPQDSLVLVQCGIALISVAYDHDRGLDLAKRAVELNPYDERAVMCAGVAHIWAGDLDEAEAMLVRAVELSPGMPNYAFDGLGHCALIRGDFPKALDYARRALAENPTHDFTQWLYIAANAHMGRMEEARRGVAAYLAEHPGATVPNAEPLGRYRDPLRAAHVLDGLRLAGLPEK